MKIIDAHVHLAQCIAGFGAEGELRACGGGKAVYASGNVINMIPPELGEYDVKAEKVLELTKRIISERKITCLMVTHNMHQALELGNRTLMMDAGHIVLDVKGEERSHLTVDDLLSQFSMRAGKKLDNDRILLSK